jgi:hypothetical protein
MPNKVVLKCFKIAFILFLGLIGGMVGAILIGVNDIDSIWLSIGGGVLGFVVGGLMAVCLILLNRPKTETKRHPFFGTLISFVLCTIGFGIAFGLCVRFLEYMGNLFADKIDGMGIQLLMYAPVRVTRTETLMEVAARVMDEGSITMKLYVVLSWITAVGFSMFSFWQMPRFHLAVCMLFGVVGSTMLFLNLKTLSMPFWMPTAGAFGLLTLAFFIGRMESRHRVERLDWLDQNVGARQQVIGPEDEADKPTVYHTIWKFWCATVGILFILALFVMSRE